MNSSKVYHESFGELTKEQLALYKASNISPSDHDQLEALFPDDTEGLILYVKQNSEKGYFVWDWFND